jgi:hypothetical protein
MIASFIIHPQHVGQPGTVRNTMRLVQPVAKSLAIRGERPGPNLERVPDVA